MMSVALRLAPALVLVLVAAPVVAGLLDVVGPAFGYMPRLGQAEVSLAPFATVFATPGIWVSMALSFWMGPAVALTSLALATIAIAGWSDRAWFKGLLATIRPVLALPHAAAAFGLAFLVMPSGFFVRLLSPTITGFERPPDWLIINDPMGLALFAGLVIKELPFIFLVMLAALPQVDQRRIQVARSMGHGRLWSWLLSVFPAIYQQIRLPVMAVLVFAGSVVDVALILGPGTPPPLAVLILRWMNDPDLSMRTVAAAAALIQLLISLAGLALWVLGEKLAARIGRYWASGGCRFVHDHALRTPALVIAISGSVLSFLGIGILALSSIANAWRFPDSLPASVSLRVWERHGPNLIETAGRSMMFGLLSAGIAVLIVVLLLERQDRLQKPISRLMLLALFLPLLVPQISFLPGLTIRYLVIFGGGATFALVVLSHLVFVLPYVYLTLADPWAAFDKRQLAIARSLGKSETDALFQIRLPMMLAPLLTALAIGFAVSIAQYLPTLLIGAGREPTITTEAVALASGGNRRLIGAYGLVQSVLPYFMFLVAGLVPAFVFRNRRALQTGFGK